MNERKFNKINGLQVLGFFKHRENTPLRMSLREKSILKNMSKSMESSLKGAIFFLLTKNSNVKQSIHTFNYKIYTCQFVDKKSLFLWENINSNLLYLEVEIILFHYLLISRI